MEVVLELNVNRNERGLFPPSEELRPFESDSLLLEVLVAMSGVAVGALVVGRSEVRRMDLEKMPTMVLVRRRIGGGRVWSSDDGGLVGCWDCCWACGC